MDVTCRGGLQKKGPRLDCGICKNHKVRMNVALKFR
jgi:hypothetical protein